MLCLFFHLGQAEEILGDEGSWWRALEEIMCFASILGNKHFDSFCTAFLFALIYMYATSLHVEYVSPF